MKSITVSFIALILPVLVGGCSSQVPTPASPAPVASITQNRVERPSFYLPPPGQWTVSDVLQVYGDNVKNKLGYYFKKAEVSYPPRQVTLVALKQEKKLELWARDKGEFRLIRDYFIMAASGDPGPKLRQGDRQVPEGVYRVTGLNPNSNYHLSMQLNYPNKFDLVHAEEDGRTDVGSDIFIHGKHASIGCLAMGDTAIRELFVLTAKVGVQNVKVVIAPHDPRAYPLMANPEEMPEWTSILYAMITHEFETISPKMKLSKSRY